MRVGILTYYHALNYGAYWQACFLCNRLNQEEGIEAEIIDYHMKIEDYIYDYFHWPLYLKLFRFSKYKFRVALKKVFLDALNDECMKKSDDFCVSDSIDDFRNYVYGKYDVVIVGSDEVWKLDSFRGFPNPYWLNFELLGCRKLAYAVSSRSDFEKLNSLGQEMVISALEDFEFISVRDSLTYDSVMRMVSDKRKVHMMCDPSFVYDYDIQPASIRSILGKNIGLEPTKKNIVIMVTCKKITKKIYKQLNKDYNLISTHFWYDKYINVAASPKEWLQLIANADFVITDAFHGTCFSIVYNTPFLALGTPKKASKIKELFLDNEEMKKYYIECSENEFLGLNFQVLVEKLMTEVNFTSYVKAQRKSFDIFLNALKNQEI